MCDEGELDNQIEIVRAGKIPIYFAEFMIHHDCWSTGLEEIITSQEIKEIPISVTYEMPEDLKTIRFKLTGKLPTTDIKAMLRTGIQIGAIKKAIVRLNGDTIFELTVSDEPLNIVSSVEKLRLPFSDVTKYAIRLKDDTIYEFFKLYISSTDRKDARELIRNIEDELKRVGEAYLDRMGEVDTEEYTLPELIDFLKTQPIISLLRPNEIRILKTALEMGYFDTPKKVTLDDLSAELGINRTQLNTQLRNITKKISKAFLDELREFFLEEE